MLIVLTKEYNILVNSEELIGTTEYLTLQTRFRTNRCRYNRSRPYYTCTYTRIADKRLISFSLNTNTLTEF